MLLHGVVFDANQLRSQPAVHVSDERDTTYTAVGRSLAQLVSAKSLDVWVVRLNVGAVTRSEIFLTQGLAVESDYVVDRQNSTSRPTRQRDC